MKKEVINELSSKDDILKEPSDYSKKNKEKLVVLMIILNVIEEEKGEPISEIVKKICSC